MSEQAPFVLWTTDTDRRFTSSVGSGLKSIGLKPDEVRGMSVQEFSQSSDPNLPLVAAHRQALFDEARVALARSDLASAKAKAASRSSWAAMER